MTAASRLLPGLPALGIGLALAGEAAPARAHSLAELDQRLQARETYFQVLVNQTPMRDQVRFVTITTDPVRDTPDMLRAYGAKHGLDPMRPGTRPRGPG
jgi:hypothetical protein